MQRYTIFFIIVNALHVSGGFSAHHQELKNCIHSIWYVSGLLAATASGSSKQGGKMCAHNTHILPPKSPASQQLQQDRKL
jgi:hypothetical protein